MKAANIVFLLVGIGMLVESIALRRFLNTSEAGDAEDDGFKPRWYHRLAMAVLGVGVIAWNVIKLYR
jgi:hypothetical protein